MVLDGLNAQKAADRSLITQAAVQAEMVEENDQFGQGKLQFFDSCKRMFETLPLDDLDKGFSFAVAFGPIWSD